MVARNINVSIVVVPSITDKLSGVLGVMVDDYVEDITEGRIENVKTTEKGKETLPTIPKL